MPWQLGGWKFRGDRNQDVNVAVQTSDVICSQWWCVGGDRVIIISRSGCGHWSRRGSCSCCNLHSNEIQRRWAVAKLDRDGRLGILGSPGFEESLINVLVADRRQLLAAVERAEPRLTKRGMRDEDVVVRLCPRLVVLDDRGIGGEDRVSPENNRS